MRNKIKKVWDEHHRLLRALSAAILIAAVGGLLFWALSPAPQAGQPTTATGEAPVVWTCSMHPEVRLPEPGLCPKCQMALTPAKAGTDGGEMRELAVTENARALMDVETTTVERMFPTAEIRMVGKVAYDESRLSYITAWVGGRLDRLFVDYTGLPVKKGDHMVSIYSPELYSAQNELLQAQKAVRDLDASDVGIVRQTASSTVEAAREKLRLLGLSAAQIAQIEQRGKAEEHVTINAPVSGIVVHKNAAEGMYVQTGTRIYTIADLSRVWVKLDAYEADLSWLRYGQKVEFTSVSYPGEVFTGTIAFIDPILNPETRTVKVRVNVPNPNGKLKPDMFVNAVVHSQVAAGGRVLDEALAGKWMCSMHPEVVKDAPGSCDICGMDLVKAETLGYVSAAATEQDKPLVIPVSAALVTGTRAIVYVEKPDAKQPTYEGREVVLGPRAGDYYLVRHGLSEGERVVTQGNFKIDSALQIEAKPSMMTPEGGGAATDHQHGPAVQPAPDGKPADQTQLPAAFTRQLSRVVTAAGKVQDVLQGGDIAAIRAAFADLDQTLRAVDARFVKGHALMLWKELSMRLGNDAFEGKEAKTIAEARKAAQSLKGNIASLRSRFSIDHAAAAAAPVQAVPEAFRKQLDAVFAGYFQTTKALAVDDAAKAAEGLRAMSAALAKVDAAPLSPDARAAWGKHKAALEKILSAALQAETLQKQRQRLAPLSEEAVSVARRYPPDRSRAYYLLHCPMAFDNRGAIWLQDSEPVQNPYFGSAMPQCGEVREMIGGDEAPASTKPAAPAEHKHD